MSTERDERVPEHCTWSCQTDPDIEVWETTCGNMFQFETDGPSENKMRYCCYCGGKLLEAAAETEEGGGDGTSK